jgi:hypothetical protein
LRGGSTVKTDIPRGGVAAEETPPGTLPLQVALSMAPLGPTFPEIEGCARRAFSFAAVVAADSFSRLMSRPPRPGIDDVAVSIWVAAFGRDPIGSIA